MKCSLPAVLMSSLLLASSAAYCDEVLPTGLGNPALRDATPADGTLHLNRVEYVFADWNPRAKC